MRHSKNRFRHESIQDAQTIQDVLKSVTRGIARGRLTFSDGDGEIILQPEGLLNLKVTASQDEPQSRVDIRITWHNEEKSLSSQPLRINKGRNKKKGS